MKYMKTSVMMRTRMLCKTLRMREKKISQVKKRRKILLKRIMKLM